MSLDITGPIQEFWPNCPVPLLQGIIDTADDVFAKCQMAGNRLRILHFMTQISAETMLSPSVARRGVEWYGRAVVVMLPP